MKSKIAFITGITGQDGSYLAELLLKKGYQVHGLRRRTSLFNSARIDHIIAKNFSSGDVQLHYGDLSDSSSLVELVARLKPAEIYNLGAQSHVGVSFNTPEYTCDVDALGTLRLLQAIRHTSPQTKFYQASSSEMFGKVLETPQKETTPFNPQSPYAISKVFSYWTTRNYRDSYSLFACNGILFNHESSRRGRTFVTRKITRAVADIYHKKQKILYLGNIHASRDWGHAKDCVEAMYLMMQHQKPDDFVVATGETHTVKEFVELAFEHIGIIIKWKGRGLNEVGYDAKTKKTYVKIDPQYFRPAEVEFLLGDPSKAKKVLGWKPKYSFKKLVKEMLDFDIKNEGLSNGYVNY
ncbi:GDP-mannose 4,6-dehydratase [Patescibacteria group bacterium]|nr:GDP-mannose 4,6-dehydratase [Patescibacteria group bacterium]MBU1970615.1 GDP-mannose 4,6-dehydratase [Patescibacteria group bacterium]